MPWSSAVGIEQGKLRENHGKNTKTNESTLLLLRCFIRLFVVLWSVDHSILYFFSNLIFIKTKILIYLQKKTVKIGINFELISKYYIKYYITHRFFPKLRKNRFKKLKYAKLSTYPMFLQQNRIFIYFYFNSFSFFLKKIQSTFHHICVK